MVSGETVNGYGLDPVFERECAIAACTRSDFWTLVGNEVEIDGLQDPVVQTVFRAVATIAEKTGRGPSSPSVVVQRVKSVFDRGKLTRSQFEDTREFLLDAMERESLDLDAVVAELADVVKHRIQQTAIDEGIRAHANHSDMRRLQTLLERADRVGKSNRALGTIVGGSVLNDVRKINTMARLGCGVQEIDEIMRGGPPRKTYNVVVGPSGGGKSIFMNTVYTTFLAHGGNALYLSMELSDDLQIVRTISSLTQVPSDDIMSSDEAFAEAEKRMQSLESGGYLGLGIVRYESARSMSVEDVDRWIEDEEAARGVRFDLLVVDYASLLVDPSKKVDHESLASVAVKLRELAMRRNLWVWTGAQPTGEGMSQKTKRIDLNHTGGSLKIAHTADTVITINPEPDNLMARYFLAKFRSGKSREEVGPLPTDFEYGRSSPVTWDEWPFDMETRTL